ncbi:TetR/AcrR family transcriptional regulator [Actinocorallia longicatena]
MTMTAGLRERKKAATRQALNEAAVRLAIEHGLDNVTVEAIAEAANVSRRTFSNYFADKEEAVLYTDEVRRRRLHELVAARPPAEPAWAALCGAAGQLIAENDEDPDHSAQIRLLRRHPSLLGRMAAGSVESERVLAGLVVDRIPASERPPAEDGRPPLDPDLDARLRARTLAAALESALRIATLQWLDDPGLSLPRTLHHLLAAAADPWH